MRSRLGPGDIPVFGRIIDGPVLPLRLCIRSSSLIVMRQVVELPQNPLIPPPLNDRCDFILGIDRSSTVGLEVTLTIAVVMTATTEGLRLA